MNGLPADLVLTVDPAAGVEWRAALGREIGGFHAATVPGEARRFGLALRDRAGGLAGGVSAVMQWEWLFVEALFVAAPWRKTGVGRALMGRAEAHARAEGCRAVWLDSFQAGDFYLRLGYEMFGALADYPPGQTRRFFRKALV